MVYWTIVHVSRLRVMSSGGCEKCHVSPCHANDAFGEAISMMFLEIHHTRNLKTNLRDGWLLGDGENQW